jgi:hypothetical protein
MDPLDPKDHFHGGDTQRQPVLGPLLDLLTDLDRIRRGDLPPGWAKGLFGTWEGEYDIYIDKTDNNFKQFNVNINMYDGKLLIRVER